MNKKIPDRKDLKPLNLFDTIFFVPDGHEILSAIEPRWLPIYPHLSRDEAQRLYDYLGERLKHKHAGEIVFCIMGRLAG